MSLLKPYQREYVAMGIAAGNPAEAIVEGSKNTLDLEAVQKAIKSYERGESPLLQELVVKYRMEEQYGQVVHRMKLRDYQDKAYDVIGATLDQDQDRRLRYEAAWDVIGSQGHLRPKDAAAAAGPTAQFNIYADNRVQTALSSASHGIADLMTQMKDSLGPLGGDRHTTTNTETTRPRSNGGASPPAFASGEPNAPGGEGGEGESVTVEFAGENTNGEGDDGERTGS